jgi:predicted nucleic acid-binding protein
VIVLDTNIVSELMRPKPAPEVIDWLNSVTGEQIFITSVTVAEMLYGIVRMPTGRHKATLAAKARALLTAPFDGHALAFTVHAAVEYAEIVADRERLGRPIGRADAQIAAICRLNRAALATRNVRDFAETGVRVIDPWAE